MNTAGTIDAGAPESLRNAKRFFAAPERYLRRNYRIPLRVRIVRQLVGELVGSRVLDLGCGDGSISAQFLGSGNRLTLVDYSASMLERARGQVPAAYQSQVEYVHSDISSFTPAELYDLVLCIGVLSHVHSIDATIQKVAGCVRPWGRAVFQLTDDDQAFIALSKAAYAARRLARRSSLTWHGMTLRQVVAAADAHGLEVVGLERHLLLLFPGMATLLGRWLLPYDNFTRKHPWLAKHGTNVILVCRKRLPERP